MAQFQNMIITRAGLDMIAQSQAGGTLIFTKGKLGDGQIGDQSIPDLTDLINAKMSVELSSVTAKTEGHVEVRFIVDNTDLDVGFFVREVGIFAKVNEEGVEQLYGYANAGNYTNYLADKTVPIDSIITKIDLVVGNACNVAFTTDKSLVYVTLEDMENALNAHDAGTDAHEPAFDAHNAADDAHKDFTGATAEAAGKRGFVPAPKAGDQNKALFGNATYKSVVQSINGITPTSGDVDINRKFYNSLAQLGLNYDTVTFDQIANTLPVNSTLTFYVDIVTSQPVYAPNLDIPVSGFIVVTKGDNNTVPIKFTLSPIANNATTYLGEYTTYNSYGFKGWQPIVLSVSGAKPNYTGNVTVPVDTYTEWKWSGNGATIDGFTVTFTNGFKMAIWYMLFPNQTNQLTVNFLTPFATPPCVFGSVVVKDGTIHLIPNVFNITTTSVTCVTNNTAGATGTYWVAMGYDA